MIILMIGGSGSGKSAYAEKYLDALSTGCRKYYIATMQVYDKEGMSRIERHRSLRSGKGFHTIEQPLTIESALEKTEQFSGEANAALLECMTNLVANEMFSGEVPKSCKEVSDKIVQGVMQLSKGLKHLVIVSGNLFEDGMSYDEATMEYIRAMGCIHEKLTGMADQVVEVVAGIPIMIKEGK